MEKNKKQEERKQNRQQHIKKKRKSHRLPVLMEQRDFLDLKILYTQVACYICICTNMYPIYVDEEYSVSELRPVFSPMGN